MPQQITQGRQLISMLTWVLICVISTLITLRAKGKITTGDLGSNQGQTTPCPARKNHPLPGLPSTNPPPGLTPSPTLKPGAFGAQLKVLADCQQQQF